MLLGAANPLGSGQKAEIDADYDFVKSNHRSQSEGRARNRIVPSPHDGTVFEVHRHHQVEGRVRPIWMWCHCRYHSSDEPFDVRKA